MINFVHTVEQATYEIGKANDLLSCFNDFCEENLKFSDEEKQYYYVISFMRNIQRYRSLILAASNIIETQTKLLDEAAENVNVRKK